MEKEKFFDLYYKVFDINGNVKPCGREVCKKLITISQNINNDVNFGEIETGFMNIENIKDLYKKLKDNV